MEEGKRLVITSDEIIEDIGQIYAYGVETFGKQQAEKYEHTLWSFIERLEYEFLMYPECRWLPTQGRIYRNIILESHLIIYRINIEQIEVLKVINSHMNVSKIRAARKVKI